MASWQRTHAARAVACGLLLLSTSACAEAGGVAEWKHRTAPGSPVIAQPERVDSCPAAQVAGPLVLRQGCLLVGDDLVFWPHGASWDEEAHAVVFRAPPFEDAPAIPVGTDLDGGGGYYDGDTDFASWLGNEFAASIRECQEKTGTSSIVYVYPTIAR